MHALQPEIVDNFFGYATERQRIFLSRKAGNVGRWTDDPILHKFRFCNVFREDDRVTRWCKKNVRSKFKGPDLVFACTMFRMFNRENTMSALLEADAVLNFNVRRAWAAIKDIKPVVSAAYIIIGEPGYPKGLGILKALAKVHKDRQEIYDRIKEANSLEAAVDILSEYPFIGKFIAYEIVTDLRHTPLLRKATDIYTWANPGPGAARGLSRMIGMPKNYFNRGSRKDRVVMCDLMQQIQAAAATKWTGLEKWEMRDVEHTLCEFDKYERVRNGQGRPKQLYRP